MTEVVQRTADKGQAGMGMTKGHEERGRAFSSCRSFNLALGIQGRAPAVESDHL